MEMDVVCRAKDVKVFTFNLEKDIYDIGIRDEAYESWIHIKGTIRELETLVQKINFNMRKLSSSAPPFDPFAEDDRDDDAIAADEAAAELSEKKFREGWNAAGNES